jgi:hypothetical protein
MAGIAGGWTLSLSTAPIHLSTIRKWRNCANPHTASPIHTGIPRYPVPFCGRSARLSTTLRRYPHPSHLAIKEHGPRGTARRRVGTGRLRRLRWARAKTSCRSLPEKTRPRTVASRRALTGVGMCGGTSVAAPRTGGSARTGGLARVPTEIGFAVSAGVPPHAPRAGSSARDGPFGARRVCDGNPLQVVAEPFR